MTRRIAATSALLVFAIAILLGLAAQNTFTTTLSRALLAMAATFGVGLVIGQMADRMAAENLENLEKKNGISEAKAVVEDR